jgi:hypothetical protein
MFKVNRFLEAYYNWKQQVKYKNDKVALRYDIGQMRCQQRSE